MSYEFLDNVSNAIRMYRVVWHPSTRPLPLALVIEMCLSDISHNLYCFATCLVKFWRQKYQAFADSTSTRAKAIERL